MRFLLIAAFCLSAGVAHAAEVRLPGELFAQAMPEKGNATDSEEPGNPATVPDDPAAGQTAPATPETSDMPGGGQSKPVLGSNGLPEVYYGDTLLPEPVRLMRQKLLDAAETGDIEKLRPIMEATDSQPVISIGEGRGDPIDFLKSQSGDPEGREILAILTEVLQAGYVHLDAGTAQDAYVWPYFASYPLDKLSSPQMVELFKIITSQDLADMKEYGSYVFFRLGISPDGKWQFFLSGD